MTKNRRRMLAYMVANGECAIVDIAAAAGVAYQTAWRWIEQQIDVGNVVVASKGRNAGVVGRISSNLFSYVGDKDEQAVTLLHRAADYLEKRGVDDGARSIAADIHDWLNRNTP